MNNRSKNSETALKADKLRLQIAMFNSLGMNGPKVVERIKKEVKK